MMKNAKIIFWSFILIFIFVFRPGQGQDRFYTENTGEFIFSFADVTYQGMDVSTPARFSMFFHAGNLVHYDFTDNVGIFSGWALRNIGFITKENNITMKRRTYSIGVPLALKIGSFPHKYYIYGGASYEMFFHYKQKQFIGGDKSKYSEWFSNRTERFAPSFFAGIQFPKGINLKFKYYPNDFLNRDFIGTDFGEQVDYSNYNRTNLFYVALSFNFRPDQFINPAEVKNANMKYASFIE